MRPFETSCRRSPLRIAGLLCVFLYLIDTVSGERLPIKTYTTADGLAHDTVNRILSDSRGFLWFATAEGLSRFDGYQFTNYTTDSGLPHRYINDILETRSGIYFVATGNGVARFIPNGRANSRFAIYGDDKEKPRAVNVMAEDQDGVIWCGTSRGLYQLVPNDHSDWIFRNVDIGIPNRTVDDARVYALLVDRAGALWAGSGSGLYRRWFDGRVERYTTQNGLPSDFVYSLLQDSEGHLWAGMWHGLCEVITDSEGIKVVRLFTERDGLGERVIGLFQSSDKRLWALSAVHSLTEIVMNQATSPHVRSFTSAQGLGTYFQSIAEDREGNLWLGTESSGAMKLIRDGMTTYKEGDGLGSGRIASIIADRSGDLCAISSLTNGLFINHYDGTRFSAVHPLRIKDGGWGWNQISFQDHTGEWWVATGEGLSRYPKVNRTEDLARTAPKAIYTTRDGLFGDNIFRLYEDRKGDIWIGANSLVGSGLTRWERATDSFQRYTQADGIPSATAPSSFAEDSQGNLWIGFWGGGLARYRDHGFEPFLIKDGLPPGAILAIYSDHAGRLWIASSNGGASRIDDPSAEHPRFVTFNRSTGLLSNDVWCITEDNWGRIYFGTSRGIDRLDPSTGAMDDYTISDGLPNSDVQSAFRDRNGVLWFGTPQGLAKFEPQPARPPTQPPIMISAVRVSGSPYPISELGETEIRKLELRANQSEVQIDFVGLDFGSGEDLRYQYKLEGAGRDWSAPTEQRSITFANLAPGSYRFLVRAISNEGGISPQPAAVQFTILPPIWRTWWFLLLAMTVLAAAAYLIYRYRVAQLLKVERVRTRIAADLHDDIGSSLSQIAVLSEVVRKQIDGRAAEFARPLAQIARVSREAVDSMSDIVWAINPQKDHLYDLTRRMRRFVSEVFPARGIEFRFRAPAKDDDVWLGADLRRQLFLIFKEGVNNVVRHSKCAQAEIDLRREGEYLVLDIKDDGCGFDLASLHDGNGLPSLKRRASTMGGELKIKSQPGTGTAIVLKVPYKSHRFGSGALPN